MNNLKGTRCENCGHDKDYHGKRKGYEEPKKLGKCYFSKGHQSNSMNIIDFICDCKQFINLKVTSPSEDVTIYDNIENNTLKGMKGCGNNKILGVDCLCPSCSICPQCDMGVSSCLCSNHSPTNLPSRRENLGKEQVSQGKEPDRTICEQSGLDIPLSDKIFNHIDGRKFYFERDVAEAVRKLKEEIDNIPEGKDEFPRSKSFVKRIIKKKINKIFGEFK